MEDPSWPRFLDFLDSDPIRAKSLFSAFYIKWIRTCPPKLIYQLDEKGREDVVQDIYVQCTDDDFGGLRKYKNVGRSFEGWFHILCRNSIYDYLRKKTREKKTVKELDKPIIDSENNPIRIDPVDSKIDPLANEEKKEELRIVSSCIEMLDIFCHLLLVMSRDEMTIAEMLRALRMPKTKNKWLSDKRKYCRSKLYKLIAENGLGPA